ncbi:MAG TPA: hypothetical protein VH165_17335 [Kofleriaceae bacterium]|nr:hypothetical protein [Kofleriaceae bacterium]
MTAAQHLLDQVQSIARIEALEADPAAYAACLADELGAAGALAPPGTPETAETAETLATPDTVATPDTLATPDTVDGLEARDAQLRHALAQLDAMIERAARIRLDHALADDAAIATPTRKVFATTILGYAGRIELLEARAREVAARGGARDPDAVAGRVAEVARAVLALREAMRGGVLDVIRGLAAAAVPIADRHARDRRLAEPVRRRWSAARRDLEAIAGQPEAIAAAAMATRLGAWPDQLDEPDPAREPTFADLIELD